MVILQNATPNFYHNYYNLLSHFRVSYKHFISLLYFNIHLAQEMFLFETRPMRADFRLFEIFS